MGIILTLIGGCVGILAVLITLALNGTFDRYDEAPPMATGWWGRGDPQKDNTEIKPFKIKVSDKELKDIKTRIGMARVGEDLVDGDFRYGFQATFMKDVLIPHWLKKFDWRKQEAVLNQYPHFSTTIEGISVHFQHAKPTTGVKARPILLLHGWPGSIWEFHKLLPLLTTGSDVFEVICPSIPGYGYSEAPHRKGFDGVDAARMYHTLMLRLGHDKYYVQGGDWGGMIATLMSIAYPNHVRGVHLNFFPPPLGGSPLSASLKQFVIGPFWPSLVMDPAEAHKVYPLKEKLGVILMHSGYFHMQATKPDTIGMALNESPVALAAYILEKFSCWTNLTYERRADGGLTEVFTLDELLTNVMIYWTTGSITSSVRFYKEFFNGDVAKYNKVPVKVPTGLAWFPGEIAQQPREFAKYKYHNMIQYTDMPRGGHFAAMQEPKLMADDIRAFVGKVEK